jgi:tRNA (mo5U34)-methyltransferase
MTDAGYQNIELIDLSPTTTEEQRTTSWMRFESLDKSLAPRNTGLTVEGLPAPLRAMLIGAR